MTLLMPLALVLTTLAGFAVPAGAQSPHTSAIVIVVTDQSGAVITDAKAAMKTIANQ